MTTMTTNETWIKHPGYYIREEMAERGWLQRDLAFILGVPEKAINAILQEKRGISPTMARALGEAFDVPAEFFANLQQSYELAQAQEPSPAVALRGQMQSKYPVREMIKRGWIEDSDVAMLQEQLSRFFMVKNLDEVPYMKYAAFKSKYEERNIPPEQLAWLFRIYQIAKSIAMPKYSEKALRGVLPDLERLLSAPEEARHVPRILADCGVRFILAERLPGANIDGVCFWLDEASPVIGMTTRLDKIDNFWFVVRHEIEHVLNKHGQDEEILDVELDGEKTSSTDLGLPEQERIANAAAANFCAPAKKLDSFMVRKHPFYYENDVVAFARMYGRHSGLIVGQMQYRLKDYRYLRRHLVQIRKFVLPGSFRDGWGSIFPVSL